jgi:glycolate oxidase
MSFHQQLNKLLDGKDLLFPPEDLSSYSQDASRISSQPCAVLKPRTSSQVVEIVRLADRHRLPIAVRGGGTGLDGGAVSGRGGLLISLEQMDHIVEISAEDMIAVVQPGVNSRQLNAQLASVGLFYPIDPAWQARSTIGGNIATRAHGLRGMKYGRIGNYLLGLEAVVAPGEIIRGGAKTLKCATGYHLADLFAGSRGHIGIITEIILKLLPRPQARASLMAVFNGPGGALRVREALRDESIHPARIELMDGLTVQRGFSKVGRDLSPDHFLLLLELDGTEPVVHDDAQAALKLFADQGASRSLQASDEDQARDWWTVREKLLAELVGEKDLALVLTTTLPPGKTNAFFQRLQDLDGPSSHRLMVYGHLGEGRWHVVICTSGKEKKSVGELARIARDVISASSSCGGLHLRPVGIGIAPPASIVPPPDPGQADLWHRLKERFDPENLFKPLD